MVISTNLTDFIKGSKDLLKKVEEVKAKILSGEVVVPGTKAEFEKEFGDKYELD